MKNKFDYTVETNKGFDEAVSAIEAKSKRERVWGASYP